MARNLGVYRPKYDENFWDKIDMEDDEPLTTTERKKRVDYILPLIKEDLYSKSRQDSAIIADLLLKTEKESPML